MIFTYLSETMLFHHWHIYQPQNFQFQYIPYYLYPINTLYKKHNSIDNGQAKKNH